MHRRTRAALRPPRSACMLSAHGSCPSTMPRRPVRRPQKAGGAQAHLAAAKVVHAKPDEQRDVERLQHHVQPERHAPAQAREGQQRDADGCGRRGGGRRKARVPVRRRQGLPASPAPSHALSLAPLVRAPTPRPPRRVTRAPHGTSQRTHGHSWKRLALPACPHLNLHSTLTPPTPHPWPAGRGWPPPPAARAPRRAR